MKNQNKEQYFTTRHHNILTFQLIYHTESKNVSTRYNHSVSFSSDSPINEFSIALWEHINCLLFLTLTIIPDFFSVCTNIHILFGYNSINLTFLPPLWLFIPLKFYLLKLFSHFNKSLLKYFYKKLERKILYNLNKYIFITIYEVDSKHRYLLACHHFSPCWKEKSRGF